jgi:hypothetical protein
MVGHVFRTAAVAALLIGSMVLCAIALNGAARAQTQSPYRPAAQSLPPVDLGIPNVPQKTRVWCWAAVAQQVIISKRGSSPPQCALVAMVHGRRPSYCCPDYHNCAVPGRLSQIRKLIRNFGRSASSLERPTDPMTLYATLRAGKPVIIALRNTRYTGHTVVVTGLSWVQGDRGPVAMLHINDPIGALPPRVPYELIRARWAAAIIVH